MATYTKLRDGSWGIKGQGVQEGQTVLVTKRSGENVHERVGKILWQGSDGTVIATLASGASVSTARRTAKAMFASSRKACRTGGNCSSFGSGNSCGGYDCDGY
jgi:hypothetical protein